MEKIHTIEHKLKETMKNDPPKTEAKLAGWPEKNSSVGFAKLEN